MPPDSMECVGLILSDQVIKDASTGKLSLINCFTTLNSAAFPFLAPPFFVTALVSGPMKKGEPVQFSVSIKKRDAEVFVLKVDGHAVIQGMGDPDEVVEMVWGIPQLSFLEVGAYELAFAINGEEIGTRPLLVKATTGVSFQVK